MIVYTVTDLRAPRPPDPRSDLVRSIPVSPDGASAYRLDHWRCTLCVYVMHLLIAHKDEPLRRRRGLHACSGGCTAQRTLPPTAPHGRCTPHESRPFRHHDARGAGGACSHGTPNPAHHPMAGTPRTTVPPSCWTARAACISVVSHWYASGLKHILSWKHICPSVCCPTPDRP